MGLFSNYFRISLLKIVEYRSRVIFSGIVFSFLSLSTPLIIFLTYEAGSNLGGWSFGQILFLNAFFILGFGIYRAFFNGIRQIQVEVKNGTFERYLTRPINPLLHVILANLNPEEGGGVISGIVLLILSSQSVNFLFFLPLLVVSLAVIFSIHLFVSSLSFWFVEVNSLYWGIVRLTEYSKYPLNIYNPFLIGLFSTIIPLGIISYYPSSFLLGLTNFSTLIVPFIFSIFFMIFSILFFKLGVKNYTSAGG